jgi:hypothetical protein
MTRKKILGSHVKRLLSGVSDHGRRHLNEVETDLVQTTLLLEEAVEKLTTSFMAIHQAVDARQQSINRLLAGEAPSAEESEKLTGMSGEIGQHVNTAITSMQFQDMTSQLLDRTLRRVSGLREFLTTLSEHGADIAPDSRRFTCDPKIFFLVIESSRTIARPASFPGPRPGRRRRLP